jgi:LacI family transcriptional regulator, galactose operon repressor
LGEAGLSALERISFGGGTIEGCRAAIEQDLRRSNPPTAIFAATFYATLGAVKAINALDLAFPEEISLLGFEHSEWMMAIRPYVSAVRQSVDDLAAVSWRTPIVALVHRVEIGVLNATPENLRLVADLASA